MLIAWIQYNPRVSSFSQQPRCQLLLIHTHSIMTNIVWSIAYKVDTSVYTTNNYLFIILVTKKYINN